jgi:hypothetical protein
MEGEVVHLSLLDIEAAYPDLFLHVGSSDLSAHTWILNHRVPLLLVEKKKSKEKIVNWKNPKKLVVGKKEDFSVSSVKFVLKWAYGLTEFDANYTPFKAIEVMRLCKVYKLPRLMQMNEAYLIKNLSEANLFSLLKFSDSLEVSEAKDLCLELALQHPDLFVSSSAELLGFKLFQDYTTFVIASKGKEIPYRREVTAVNTIVEDFKRIYESASLTGDVTFLVRTDPIKAHLAILWQQSPAMASLIKAPPKSKESHQIIMLASKYEGISPAAFQAMLRFFYYRDINIEERFAAELIDFAKDFRLDNLQSVLVRLGAPQNTLSTSSHTIAAQSAEREVTLSISGENKEVVKLRVFSSLSYEELLVLVANSFQGTEKFKLRYFNVVEDLVRLESEGDWRECLAMKGDTIVLHLSTLVYFSMNSSS